MVSYGVFIERVASCGRKKESTGVGAYSGRANKLALAAYQAFGTPKPFLLLEGEGNEDASCSLQ